MKQTAMRKLYGLALALFCMMAFPAQSLAAKKVHAAKPSRAVHPFKPGKTFRDCKTCPEMVVIRPGKFDMGSPDSEEGRSNDEGPVHNVTIAAFAMGKTEITRGEFAEFVKQSGYITVDKCWTLENGRYDEREGSWRKPGYPQNDRHPVTCINWSDADAYAKWLSNRTGKLYRLPTEAEWEYAARGGTRTSRYWGDKPDRACRYANGADNTARARIPGARAWTIHRCRDGHAYTAPVGSFKPNAFGLYDMLGNVWEWTEDNYHDSYQDAPAVGSAWLGGGSKRVLRGGSWNDAPRNMRAAIRYGNKPEIRFSSFGFRLARTLK